MAFEGGRVARERSQFLLLCFATGVVLLMMWVAVRTVEQEGPLGRRPPWRFHFFSEEGEGKSIASFAGDLGEEEVKVDKEKKPVILMWTNYYEVKGEKLMSLILTGREWDPGCCQGAEVTLDRGRLEEATAVVIFSYATNLKKNDLPKSRRPDQLWVLFGNEAPFLSPNLAPYNSLFNWTMTYRQDSDIWAPYGEKVPLSKPSPSILFPGNLTLPQWLQGKTSLLAGVASHCHTQSKREDFAKLLNKTCPVHIYGGCGTHICSRHNSKCDHAKWWGDLAAQYKFYFAAENSLCHDYITEKFWRALELGMVPVAYGGGNYSSEAPPNSFIDTRDYPSAKALGKYLLHLDKHPEEYGKFFEWRKRFTVRKAESWQAWCKLCRAVQDYKKGPSKKVYKDLGGWWKNKPPPGKGSVCSKPNLK